MDRDIKIIPSPNLSSYYYYGFYEGLNISTQFKKGSGGGNINVFNVNFTFIFILPDHFKQRISQERLKFSNLETPFWYNLKLVTVRLF